MQAAMLVRGGGQAAGQALGRRSRRTTNTASRRCGLQAAAEGGAARCRVRRRAVAGAGQDRRRRDRAGAGRRQAGRDLQRAPSAPTSPKFVREGNTRGLFEDRAVVSVLTGEPEYLDPLKDEAPEGWIVTGYPWDQHQDAGAHGFLRGLPGEVQRLPAARLGGRLRHHASRSPRHHQGRHRHREDDRGLQGPEVSTRRSARSSTAPIDHQSTWAPTSARPRSRTARA